MSTNGFMKLMPSFKVTSETLPNRTCTPTCPGEMITNARDSATNVKTRNTIPAILAATWNVGFRSSLTFRLAFTKTTNDTTAIRILTTNNMGTSFTVKCMLMVCSRCRTRSGRRPNDALHHAILPPRVLPA